MRPKLINLTTRYWDITIAPDFGASILKCRYDRQDILRTASGNWLASPDPFNSGCFPLVPFSNRMAHGQFEYGGSTIRLAANHKDHKFPIHGFGWQSNWTAKRVAKGACELSFDHTGGDWPWSFIARYRIGCEGASLIQSLSIENTGDKPMPGGLGLHPYFPDADKAEICFNAAGYWENDENMLPEKWQALHGTSDFSHFKPVNEARYDNCFTGWDGQAHIIWPSNSCHLIIQAAPDIKNLILYTPREKNYFCFEPVSHANNALSYLTTNYDPDAMTIQSGETKKLDMTMTMHKHPKV